jgi:formate-dependent nitrite reductase membrane component NrfD
MISKEEAEAASNEILQEQQVKFQGTRRRLNALWAWFYSIPELREISAEQRNAIYREAEASFYDRWQTWFAIGAWCIYLAYVIAVFLKLLPSSWSDELNPVLLAAGAAIIGAHRANYVHRYVSEVVKSTVRQRL